MNKVILKPLSAKRVKKGFPLIVENDLLTSSDQTKTKEWLEFVSQTGEYLGVGYLGRQNKGFGWVISNQKIKLTDSFFIEIFKKAKKKRETTVLSDLTTAYRCFNGEGDGLGGVTVDIYGEYALLTWYNDSIYSLRDYLLSLFEQAFPEIRGFYEKNRFEQAGIPASQHVKGEQAPEPLIIKENGVNFATYLDDGMMTGIFLDQKDVRGRLVDGLAAGLEVLNTFSYTGAFSVAAAMGGASKTVSVDLAKRSREKTVEMFEVNQLELSSHQIVVMDIFDYIKYAQRHDLSFDMVILDPPGFARNKKRNFSVAKNYGELVNDIVSLTRKKGYLIASTNVANVTYEKFVEMVETGIRQHKRSFKKQEEYRLPGDFTVNQAFIEGNYLKVLIYQLDV